jgi:putative addiction module component (TIGR02574 family)
MEELLRLPAAERADAARELLQSLDGADDPDELDTAWRDEIATRVAEIEDGSVQLEDGATVMRRLRERARARLARTKP